MFIFRPCIYQFYVDKIDITLTDTFPLNHPLLVEADTEIEADPYSIHSMHYEMGSKEMEFTLVEFMKNKEFKGDSSKGKKGEKGTFEF